jgi:hypothetical protein
VRERGLASAALGAGLFWGLSLADHVLFGPLPVGQATVAVGGLAAGGALVLLIVAAPVLALSERKLVEWASARASLVGRAALSLLVSLFVFTLACFLVYFAAPRIPASTTNVVASLSTFPVAAALGLLVFRKTRGLALPPRGRVALGLGFAALGLGVSGWIYPYNTTYEWAHTVALGVLSLTALAVAIVISTTSPGLAARGRVLSVVALLVLGGLALELALECRSGYARWDLAVRGGRIARALARNARVVVSPPPLALSPLVARAKPARSADFALSPRVSRALRRELRAVKPTGILLLTVDAARADFGGTGRRLPTFERLANEGIVFRSHYTAAGSTRPAIHTFFQGTWPWMNGKRMKSSLFRVFRTHGFRTLVVLPNDYPLQTNRWLRDDVDQLVTDTRPALPRGPVADQTTDALLRGLARVGSAPFLAWAHYLDPHAPYDAEGSSDRERYVGELARVDREIGRLLVKLEATGLLARTLVVLSADHGEEFFEHGGEDHGLAVYDESVRVPLVFRAPGGAVRGHVDVPSSGLDLGPTLLELAGVRVDEPFGGFGEDLFAASPGRTVFAINRGVGAVTAPATSFAAIRGRYKLVYSPYYESAELYDLRADPRETRNLVDDYPAVVSGLARDLTRVLKKSGLRPN